MTDELTLEEYTAAKRVLSELGQTTRWCLLYTLTSGKPGLRPKEIPECPHCLKPLKWESPYRFPQSYTVRSLYSCKAHGTWLLDTAPNGAIVYKAPPQQLDLPEVPRCRLG